MADDAEAARAAEETARALMGLPVDWTVLHDVRWPGRRHAEIDHVVVGPGGVFVVDARIWSEPVDLEGGVLRVGGRSRTSVVSGTAAAAGSLAAGTRLSRRLVRGVLCVVGQPVRGRAGDVLVCPPDELVGLLLAHETVLAGASLSSARASVASAVRRERGHSVTARAARRRARNSGSLGRLGAFLLLVAATVGLTPYAAARLDDRLQPAPVLTPELGTAVLLAATDERPPVELTPERIEGAADGRYVVRLTVRNDGDHALALGALRVELTLDDTTHARTADGPGDGLAGVRLEPGMERAVTYRFVLPAGRTAEELAVAVGDERADHARWQAD